MKMLLGRKLGMTRIFDKEGKSLPVTLIEAGPCIITQIKTTEKDDYEAIQIGFGEEKKINKPKTGHLKKAGAKVKWLREIRIDDRPQTTDDRKEAVDKGLLTTDHKVGDKITVNIFKPGDRVTVSGISKGKGFAGVVKRHHFAGGPASHGSDQHRAPGSIGAQQPQRVLKGRKMAGRMGGERITIKGLEVIEIDAEKNLLAVKGAVPGAKRGLVMIKSLVNRS